MQSHNYYSQTIRILTILFFLALFSHLTAVGLGKIAVVRRAAERSLIRSSKVTRQLAVPRVPSATKTCKSLKRIKPNNAAPNLLRTPSSQFSEVEIALDDKFSMKDIFDLSRAPGSDLQVLDKPRRVRIQLPDEQVKALVDKGAKVTVLRKFILYEGSENKEITLTDSAQTGGLGIETYSYGENHSNVSMPYTSEWVYSIIDISDAPAGAPVTSIDVHCTIEPSWTGFVYADLDNQDSSISYTLLSGESGFDGTISKTKTGITNFNGEPVNQWWVLWGCEIYGDGSGYINYWWIKVYYEEEPEQLNVQADSYFENTLELIYTFSEYPGTVDFSLSDTCGSLSPISDEPEQYPGGWYASTRYTPCENECSSVEITAHPTIGLNQTKTVHLDDRFHIFCCMPLGLGVSTWDPNNMFEPIPAPAYVVVTVIPPEAGTLVPTSGWSEYNSYSGLYEFWSTYSPTCCYTGRVQVKFRIDNSPYEDSILIYSFDQEPVVVPSSSWQTISDSFCPEGYFVNYYQVYKMYLYAARNYDFSLCDNDGVGAWCDGDGYLDMFDSSCGHLWYVEGGPSCDYDATTLGTIYEGWSPPSDGYYYLMVSDYDWAQMSYSLAYRGTCIAPMITKWGISATHGDVGELRCPIQDGYVEPRVCAINKLYVCFDQPMNTNISNPNFISIEGIYNGTQPHPCTLQWYGSDCLIITLCSALPDQDTYTITISSDIKSATGCPLGGDRDICITALKGDVDGSRTVDTQDMLAIRPHGGEAVDCNNARYDVNCSGKINAQDMLAVRPNAGHTAPGCTW